MATNEFKGEKFEFPDEKEAKQDDAENKIEAQADDVEIEIEDDTPPEDCECARASDQNQACRRPA